MDLKKYIYIILLTVILGNIHSKAFSTSAKQNALIKKQSKTISKVITREKNRRTQKKLIEIINYIDSIYGDIESSIKNNKKITIFFDPAHGKLKNGNWQGAVTNRLSCTNKPEEYYSIQISRFMYNYLSANKYINIETTKDYLEVLQGKSDSYNNIPFSETIRLAKKCNAFIIISEHLNNVSILYKASGKINLPGIHITRDKYGRKVLQYVKGSYSGFLTLYNELDASGFSKSYALSIKNQLLKQGLKANKWQFGAVGDDRFSYFVNFPISVIYESGFISNKDEEQKLRDPSYQQIIAFGQYNALLETFRDFFGIDISQSEAYFKNIPIHHKLERLKLSRLTVYYLIHGKTKKAVQTIKLIENKYKQKKFKSNISYYSNIRKTLQKAEQYYYLGKKYARKKWWRTSRKYYRRAYRTIEDVPIFNAYLKKYARKLGIRRRNRYSPGKHFLKVNARPTFARPKRAPLKQKIILPVEEGQTLQTAINNALDPDKKTLAKLTQSLKNARDTRLVLRRTFSKKKKRYIRKWQKVTKKVRITKGIYIITLDKKLNVKRVKRVNSVILDPKKYQNQQYLKNSYFALNIRHRSI